MAVEQTEERVGTDGDRLKSVFASGRQAIVVIHGIGDQRPMDTLRPFVDAVLNVDPRGENGAKYYSKPDGLSSTFELRRLQSRDSRPRTDYFELYWQHLVPTATWRKIYSWLTLLLGRRGREVPPALRALWRFSWTICIAVACILLLTIIVWLFPTMSWVPAWVRGPVTLPLGIAAILLLVQGVILSYVGDAATYLSPNPENIEARQAVREAGVRLLERLHNGHDPRLVYDRIVIVGHSLGSIIGYDILTHAWPRFHEVHGKTLSPAHEDLQRAERLASNLGHVAAGNDEHALLRAKDEWLKASRRLWLEQRENLFPWLVTDFITLGSPLSHALLLLARNQDEFARKKLERELPTCPPQLDNGRTFSYQLNYVVNEQARRTVGCLHHAALFAVTRWTNLFFPARFMLKGDVVGGPVAPAFGPGVVDIPVSTATKGGWLAHTSYWRADKRDRGDAKSAIRALTAALDIRQNTFENAENTEEINNARKPD